MTDQFPRTLQAIQAYYAECARGPYSYPGEFPVKAWTRERAAKAFEVRETFWQEARGEYTRDFCLKLTVEHVQVAIAHWDRERWVEAKE